MVADAPGTLGERVAGGGYCTPGCGPRIIAAMAVAVWTCPRCDRPFGRVNRPHTCVPGMPLAVWLDERDEPQRRAARAVLAVVRRHRGVVVEAVSVGVLVKRDRTLVELRARTRWLELGLVTVETIDSERIARHVELPRGRGHYYTVRLHDARDVDGDVRRWVAGALRSTRR
jgi:hypothetical protein